MDAARTSLVLIGLRRSGKSTLGRALARATARDFLDSDELLAERTGRTAADWLRVSGEAGLREQESALLEDLVRVRAHSGNLMVLALGGGAVLAPEAPALIPQLGTVIWLDISAEEARARAEAACDELARPRLAGASASEEAVLLHRQRSPIYAALSQIRVDANAPVAVVLERLLRLEP